MVWGPCNHPDGICKHHAASRHQSVCHRWNGKAQGYFYGKCIQGCDTVLSDHGSIYCSYSCLAANRNVVAQCHKKVKQFWYYGIGEVPASCGTLWAGFLKIIRS